MIGTSAVFINSAGTMKNNMIHNAIEQINISLAFPLFKSLKELVMLAIEHLRVISETLVIFAGYFTFQFTALYTV